MERLLQARESSDLGESVDGYGDVDWLRASGAVAQTHGLALALWRLLEQREKRVLSMVFDALVELVPVGCTSRSMVVSNVLTWLLDPLCHPCQGRGFAVIPGTPVLSATECPSCAGSGESAPEWGDIERELYRRVLALQSAAAGAVSKKLKG